MAQEDSKFIKYLDNKVQVKTKVPPDFRDKTHKSILNNI